MAIGFPLLRLPQNALSIALRSMSLLDRLTFSLCSKRCKEQIVTLNRTEIIRLDFTDSGRADGLRFEVRVHCRSDGSVILIRTGAPLAELNSTRDFEIYFDVGQRVAYQFNGFSARQWLEHCMEIFHRKTNTEVEIWTIRDKTHVKQIETLLSDLRLKEIHMYFGLPPEVVNEIMKLRLSAKRIILNSRLFSSSSERQKTMIQNLNTICINQTDEHEVPLEDLLLTNVRHLEIYSCKLSNKVLHRFVRLWILHPNCRLEKLTFHNGFYYRDTDEVFPNYYDSKVILQGIEYTEISQSDFEEKIRAHNSNTDHLNIQRAGGFNIMSRNGRKATIGISQHRAVSYFEFFVWN